MAKQMKHVLCTQFPSALYEHVLVNLALANLITIAVDALQPKEQAHYKKYFLNINM